MSDSEKEQQPVIQVAGPNPVGTGYLDKMECGDPECTNDHVDGLVLHSQCHTGAPSFPWYSKERGVITFKCGVCQVVILEVLVAKTTAPVADA